MPAHDRATADDERIFKRIVSIIEEHNSYRILTKYGLLNRNYSISQLNPLPNPIDLGIREITTEKVPIHCGCKDEKT